VRFATADEVIAADPEAWLQQLRRDSARLRVGFVARDRAGISDRDTTGFANGGSRWLIEVSQLGAAPTWWEPEWTVEPGRPESDRRIWSVTYWRRPGPFALSDPRPLFALFVELGETLDALVGLIQRAAPEEAMPGWIENFRTARKALAEDSGRFGRGDPGPRNFLSAEAYRMIHACRAAWVFGGMGSWNDGAYWGSVEAEGDYLSEKLFDLCQQGTVAAANSSAGSL
jgi:hypothetical protein